jgi:hypothetical protein
VTDQSQNLGPKNGARRKLLRGAFGAPAVLTLQSGSAFAATSATSCLVKQNTSPVTAPVTANATGDIYFRYQLWVIRKKTDNSIITSWIKGSDLSVYALNGQAPFVGSSSWWQFYPSTNALAGSSTSTEPTPTGSQNPLEHTGAFVALRINASGDLVGAGASGTGSAVAATCWNSFAIQSTA